MRRRCLSFDAIHPYHCPRTILAVMHETAIYPSATTNFFSSGIANGAGGKMPSNGLTSGVFEHLWPSSSFAINDCSKTLERMLLESFNLPSRGAAFSWAL